MIVGMIGGMEGVVRTITRQMKCATPKSVFYFSFLLIFVSTAYSGFFSYFFLILGQMAPRDVLSHSDKEREKKTKTTFNLYLG